MTDQRDAVTVLCPLCRHYLGTKMKSEIASFVCSSEGCSETEHYFYPSSHSRPKRSVPWSKHYSKKNKCGKLCCADKED